jgi:hypothetical protein
MRYKGMVTPALDWSVMLPETVVDCKGVCRGCAGKRSRLLQFRLFIGGTTSKQGWSRAIGSLQIVALSQSERRAAALDPGSFEDEHLPTVAEVPKEKNETSVVGEGRVTEDDGRALDDSCRWTGAGGDSSSSATDTGCAALPCRRRCSMNGDGRFHSDGGAPFSVAWRLRTRDSREKTLI